MGNSNLDPIPALLERFQDWKAVIIELDGFFVKSAQHYEALANANNNLAESVKDGTHLPPTFSEAGKAGVRDVFSQLKSLYTVGTQDSQKSVKIIQGNIRPQLQELAAALDKSIKDFKGWSSKFSSPLDVSSEMHHVDPQLAEQIKEYEQAVKDSENRKQVKTDPFILKLALDHKIEHLVGKINNQADNYAYVEDAAKSVDKSVVETLQRIVTEYGSIVREFADIETQAADSLLKEFPKQSSGHEYKHWLQCQQAPKPFANDNSKKFTQRKSDSEFSYPKQDSSYSKAIRSGSLERRARVIRSYSSGDYILTPQSLIEVNHNKTVWSANLIGATLVQDDKYPKDQFVIRASQSGSLTGKSHKFVFKSPEAQKWKHDIEKAIKGDIPINMETSISKLDFSEKEAKPERMPLANKIEETKDQVQENVEDAKDKVEDKAEDAKDKVEDKAEDAKDKAEDAKGKAKEVKKDAEDKFEDAQDVSESDSDVSDVDEPAKGSLAYTAQQNLKAVHEEAK